jgi:Fe-S cluster assembly iron-binding protein IscA
MVTLTDNAVMAIQNLTGRPDIPVGAGLRMAPDATGGSLTLSLAAEPMEGDAIVEEAGALLFLDPDVAVALGDRTIDARTDPDGQLNFTVAE